MENKSVKNYFHNKCDNVSGKKMSNNWCKFKSFIINYNQNYEYKLCAFYY